MKPWYKRETFEHILQNRGCYGINCEDCYFCSENYYPDALGCDFDNPNKSIYHHVCEVLDLEGKLEEILE